MKIPAITIWQPWASLIVHGMKRFETRSWLVDYRGPIAIHAAKKNPLSVELEWPKALFEKVVKQIGDFRLLPRGAVIGLVRLVSVCNAGRLLSSTPGFVETDECYLGDYSLGRYAWALRDPKRFVQPYQQRGQQRLWYWDVPKREQDIIARQP